MSDAGQTRLRRVQVINWGTFSGARSFDVPRSGLLLTGPSGAGKSSLLDAMAAVLVQPARVRFNVAAQGAEVGDQERNLVTYVLGAYKRETDEQTGEVGTAFARKGPTWSAIGLTFDDGAGTITTLIRCLHLRAGSTDTRDLASMYVLAPEAVDLLTLQPFVTNGIENRRLQNAQPNWEVFSGQSYSGFANKFRRRLGMVSEQAQLLLHKTQSAKNLRSLDELFRNFMLDHPGTFELSKQTVEQFDELSLAHAAVVDARRQIEVLSPLRQWGEQWAGNEASLARLAAQQEQLETFLLQDQLRDADAKLAQAEPRLARFAAELAAAEKAWAAAHEQQETARQAVAGAGGDRLAVLDERAKGLAEELERRTHRRATATQIAADLGLELPTGQAEFDGFNNRLAELVAQTVQDKREQATQTYEANARLAQARGREREAAEALEALRRHRSNLDPRLLEARELLASRLQISPDTLPFVGEQLQVRADQQDWTGAIERVLAGFARTLIVPEQYYLAAAEIVDAAYLRTRLVYEKVPALSAGSELTPTGPKSLIGKLELAAGVHHDWLADRLAARYDYACVDQATEFGRWDRAVTRAGQIKHSATRHEKDDRSQVGDRSRWVLGFNTEAKEAELGRVLADAQREVQQAEAAANEVEDEREALVQRQERIRQLASLEWVDIAVDEVRADLAEIDRQRDQLRAQNAGLAALEVALSEATQRVGEAEQQRRELATQHDRAAEAVAALRTSQNQLAERLRVAPPLLDEIAAELDELRVRLAPAPGRLEIALRDELNRDARVREKTASTLRNRITGQMTEYRREWPGQAADWASEIEYLAEYLTRLTDLADDRLPEFESRFFELLQRQARNNISQLAMQIKAARREIRNRVDEVNRSLLMTQFAPGSHLQIKVDDRRLPEVAAFLETLNQITSGSVYDVLTDDSPESRQAAEQRFDLMRTLLDRLGSDDPADRAWREKCLDTRQHVQFQAVVQDVDGRQLDVFTGSGGRSGGERQKLVTFCLAAALRYQLAPEGQIVPSYALVVIDEAFDKADHAFTQAGLEVFRTFGFQLLLATPMKMLQTIEGYVGGVVMVTNESGQGSKLQQLIFEVEEPTPPEPPVRVVEQEALL